MTELAATVSLARVAMVPLVAALLLALYRLVRGPSRADRVLALDLIAILAVGAMGVYAIDKSEPVFIETAFVTMLIAFLATVGLAFHIGRTPRPKA